MAKRTVRALVKPEILTWARETAGLDIVIAAKRLGTSTKRISAWESLETDDRPTIKQLQKMSVVYKRPLSVFYLQDIPFTFQVLQDYRRLPGADLGKYSPELVLEQRLANQRREQALELATELGIRPLRFDFAANLEEEPEVVGQRIRKILNVSSAEQFSWSDTGTAFNSWRQKIEDLGVMVFQMTRVPSDEVSGFAISNDVYPVIAINRKKTPHTRRIFSLFHEFAHLMLRQSGVSEYEIDTGSPLEQQVVEVFCNSVAAAVIMPRDLFLANEIVQNHPRSGWKDHEIKSVSKKFGTSREAVVRRLYTFDRVAQSFYEAKRTQYGDEWQQILARQKVKVKDRPFRKNPPQDALSVLGKPFIRLVLTTFYKDQITLSDVSSYLNVRVRHVPKIEQKMELT